TQGEDEFRPREQAMDHRQTQHVQRILVHQARTPAALYLAACEDQITLAQFVAIALIQSTEVARNLKSGAVLELTGERVEKWSLIHGLQTGMRIQHLFQQCGSR